MTKALGGNPNKLGNKRQYLDADETASLCKTVLDAAYDGVPCKAKAAAADTGLSPKAAENWFAGQNEMSLKAFLNAYRNNSVFRAWARKVALMEADRDPAFEAELARFIRAAQTVSAND